MGSVMTQIKEWPFIVLNFLLPEYFHRRFSRMYLGEKRINTFSQEGEDLILDRWFKNRSKGFYVDIGAFHPIIFSNTYKFYLKGWTGINLDAMPGSMTEFNKVRNGDVNLELGISSSGADLNYHMFSPGVFNTFNLEEAEKKKKWPNVKYLKSEIIPTSRLEQILLAHVPEGVDIDFISIDVEGNELDVLKSNDWVNFRPKMLIVEILRQTLDEILNNPITCFLHEQQYELIAKTANSIFYIASSEIDLIRQT